MTGATPGRWLADHVSSTPVRCQARDLSWSAKPTMVAGTFCRPWGGGARSCVHTRSVVVGWAGPGVLHAVASLPEVSEIDAPRVYHIPETARAVPSDVRTTEWGLDAIHAPQVWSTFNDRGEGIVVASIDTGVRYTHQAVVM